MGVHVQDYNFYVEGKPIVASRPRVTRWGTFYPKRHTEHAAFLDKALQDVRHEFFEGPIEVRILAILPLQKSFAVAPLGDVDNYAKLPMDCMTKAGLFWNDDRQVVALMSLKRFARPGEDPKTVVRVRNLNATGDRGVESYLDKLFWSNP